MRASASFAAAVLATASAAHADDDRSVTLVIPGYLYGTLAGTSPARAHGAELSVLHVWDARQYLGLGLLGQVQSYNGSQLRTALGGQLTWGPFGLELGWAYRRADAPQHGVHVAPYLSLGLVSFAWRTTVPIGGDGWETGFVFAAKLPIPVHNVDNVLKLVPNPGYGSWSAGGRPLRDECGEALLPEVIESRRRAHDARWLREARLEHASIESFLWLADDLDAYGAPPSLVARAERAAMEERRHAEICLARAGHGARLRSRLHPRRRRPRPTLAQLAHEAWIDGVLGEGSAARQLAREGRAKKDPLLLSIAEEEATHAELSADVLRWIEAARP
jgi:hypothetical protein